MELEPAELQLDWSDEPLRATWPARRHDYHLIMHLEALTPEVVLQAGAKHVLDVAAAQAGNSCVLSTRGVRAVAFDPSPAMITAARERMERHATRFALVRGIAETLPFREASFDCVLCHGAIDHVADPDLAVREMTRVLEPGGRLVISGVNYEGASARASRVLYRVARRFGWLRTRHLAWDSPVPVEHTFECSYKRLRSLCEPYLEMERAFGVSLCWGLPGFSAMIERVLPSPAAIAILQGLDRLASPVPAAADFVYTVWRPRPTAARPPSPAAGGYVVQPHDVVYPYKRDNEVAYWRTSGFAGTLVEPGPTRTRLENRAYTGDPARSWLDDLASRGPFRDAAVLGCDEDRHDAAWLRRDASSELDVYELSPHVIRTVRTALGPLSRRVRFTEVDLNFAALPAARYDVIWSSGCLHHIVNLEHLFAQVERALRPGGLFALHEYVGEPRFQYDPRRLARINALLAEVPARFRHGGITAITARDLRTLSPFCAVRSRDILPAAAARFDVVHRALYSSLLPLAFYLDLDAIARDEPALLARIEVAEADAARDPDMPACSAYAVFRKRA